MLMFNFRTSVFEAVQLMSDFPFLAVYASRLSLIPFPHADSGPSYDILDPADAANVRSDASPSRVPHCR